MALTEWKSLYRFNKTDGAGFNNLQNSSDIVALKDGRFVVSWTDFSNRYGLGTPDIIGLTANPLGVRQGNEIGLSDVYQDGPQVAGRVAALPTGGFVAAYQTEDQAFFTTGQNISFQGYGAAAGGNFAPFIYSRDVGTPPFGGLFGTFQTGDETHPAIAAFSNGQLFMVYVDNQTGLNSDIRALRASSTGVDTTAIAIDVGPANASAPDIALLAGSELAVVVYQSTGAAQDILFWMGATAGTVANTAADETAPVVATLTGGGFVVAWQDADGDGAGNTGIKLRIYDNLGVAAGPAFSANLTVTAGAQSAPAITALLDGTFLVAWVDQFSASIRARQFDASGNALDSEFVMADLDSLTEPSLTTLTDGRVALSVTNTNGPGNQDIYVSIWDPRGAVINGTNSSEALVGRITGGTVNGLNGNDTLYGVGAADSLNGGSGNDMLDGGAGNDLLAGGSGNDIYYVGQAGDIITEAAGDTRDTVYASTSFTLTAGAQIESLIANGAAKVNGASLGGNEFNNRITGGLGNDTVNGGAGTDTLFGNAGSDRLIGGAGVDNLFGGAGGDVFVLQPLRDDRDAIRDFVVADDQLEVTRVLFNNFDNNGAVAANDWFFSTNSSLAADANDRFIYNTVNGVLYYDRDGSGTAYKSVLIASFTGIPGLTAADFNVV